MAIDGFARVLLYLGLILISTSIVWALPLASMAEGACWPPITLRLLTASLPTAPGIHYTSYNFTDAPIVA